MEKYFETTDSFGQVNFDSFKIVRGSEGLYSFKLVTISEERLESDAFEIYMSTPVSEVVPLNDMMPSGLKNIQIGKPLSTQPWVKILGMDGRPVKGKRAVAFSWIEP